MYGSVLALCLAHSKNPMLAKNGNNSNKNAGNSTEQKGLEGVLWFQGAVRFMVFQDTKIRCILVILGNEIRCGEFGILESRISALITIPGDSVLSDRKPGDLFLTN